MSHGATPVYISCPLLQYDFSILMYHCVCLLAGIGVLPIIVQNSFSPRRPGVNFAAARFSMLREYFFPLSTSLGHFFHTQRQKSLLGSSSSGLALLSPFPSELISNDFEESGVFVGSGDLDVSVFFVDSGVFAGSGDLERLADMEMEAEGERDNVPSGVLEGSGD